MNAKLNSNVALNKMSTGAWLATLCTLFATCGSSIAQQSQPLTADSPTGATTAQSTVNEGVWVHDLGEGFRRGAQSLTLSAGAAYGVPGGDERHDLVLGSLTYGVMLDSTLNQGHWYRGNVELRVQAFGGQQFSPRDEWLVGLTPHLRYNFATGTRWIPYIDGGAGVSATSIRKPDLGGAFQFNLQAAVGVQRFLTHNVALTVEAGYMHISSAHISMPNLGVNCVTGMGGVSFFF
jgi:hypothetical protein